MAIKHQGVLLSFVKLGRDNPKAKTFRTTDDDDLSLYISSEEDILILIQSDDYFIKNDHKPTPFHENSFYRHTRHLLDELHVVHL